MTREEILAIAKKGGAMFFDKPPFDEIFFVPKSISSAGGVMGYMSQVLLDDKITTWPDAMDEEDYTDKGWREATEEEILKYVK